MDSLYSYYGSNLKIDLKFKGKKIQNSCNNYGIKQKVLTCKRVLCRSLTHLPKIRLKTPTQVGAFCLFRLLILKKCKKQKEG